MEYNLRHGLYLPLENLCLLEATAAVLCDVVLKSPLELTPTEREELAQIKEDEATHYVLAKQAMAGLQKVDQRQLASKLRDYRHDHLQRWQGPLGMIARLHEDECLVLRYMDLFDRTITGIIPDEGAAFVQAVRDDEPRHHKWGRDVLHRLIGNDEAKRRFVRQQMSAKGWPAAIIMSQFRDLQIKMGLRS